MVVIPVIVARGNQQVGHTDVYSLAGITAVDGNARANCRAEIEVGVV